jgi:hypothetical protein
MGRPGSAALLFFILSFFPILSLIENAFEAPKKYSEKIQINYRWKPCEKAFILEPFLKQNKILLKPKFGIHA